MSKPRGIGDFRRELVGFKASATCGEVNLEGIQLRMFEQSLGRVNAVRNEIEPETESIEREFIASSDSRAQQRDDFSSRASPRSPAQLRRLGRS